MISPKLYSLLILVFTIIATYFLPWWTIPIFVCILSYFNDRLTPAQALGIASGITAGVWLAWAGYQDATSVEKISVMVGKIFGNVAPAVIYTSTGLVISLVSGMAASLGRQIKIKSTE